MSGFLALTSMLLLSGLGNSVFGLPKKTDRLRRAYQNLNLDYTTTKAKGYKSSDLGQYGNSVICLGSQEFIVISLLDWCDLKGEVDKSDFSNTDTADAICDTITSMMLEFKNATRTFWESATPLFDKNLERFKCMDSEMEYMFISDHHHWHVYNYEYDEAENQHIDCEQNGGVQEMAKNLLRIFNDFVAASVHR